MTNHPKRYLSARPALVCISVITALSLMPLGCVHHPTIATAQPRFIDRCRPLDMPAADLQLGLHQALTQLSQRLGPLQIQPIVRRCTPVIRQGLKRRGYHKIRKLNLYNTTVDLEVYFLANDTSGTLMIDAFINGRAQPTVSLANHYRPVTPPQPAPTGVLTSYP